MIFNPMGGGTKEEQTITGSVEAAGNATVFKRTVSKGYQTEEKSWLDGILYHGTVTTTARTPYLDIPLGAGAEQAAALIASAPYLLVQAIYTPNGIFQPSGYDDSSILAVACQRPSNEICLLATSRDYLAGIALSRGYVAIDLSGAGTLRLSVQDYYFVANEAYTVDIFTGPV